MHLIVWLSLHCLVLFLESWSVPSFGPYIFVWAHLLHSKGKNLKYLPGQGNPLRFVMVLYVGEGSERKQCCLLGSQPAFSYFPCYPQAKWAFLVLIPGWVCVHSRILWVSPTSSPVRLGVSSAASTPTGVFNQRFEAYFPSLQPWVAQSASLPRRSSRFVYAQMWGRRVC